MRIIRSRRGIGLVDVIVTIFLLSIIGLIFSATFPVGFSCSRQAKQYKVANAIAEEKVEELRAINYESLTGPLLALQEIVDETPPSFPDTYTFTAVENVDSQLPSGTGTLILEELPNGIKLLTVTVTWEGRTIGTPRTVRLTTQVADMRTRSAS